SSGVSFRSRTFPALTAPSNPPSGCAIPSSLSVGSCFLSTLLAYGSGTVGSGLTQRLGTPARGTLTPYSRRLLVRVRQHPHPAVHPPALVYEVLYLYRFLWQVSRLNLHLVPTHPDRCAGLAFPGKSAYAFGPILLLREPCRPVWLPVECYTGK